jgi:phage tail sheath protein FI
LNGNTVVVPPSHVALYTYAYNDNISYVWFPPAGTTRGVVQNASAVGYLTTENEFKAISLTQGQRDAMYQNKLNPIATFVGNGTVIYGQKTLHTSTSALDRVNVARLVAYLRERFDALARPFLFELNDAQTRERAKLVFEKFLADILAKRGVYDYVVVCDESNNTPARIDRNELWIDVAIEPAKAVEFIYIPIRIVNTGTLATTV